MKAKALQVLQGAAESVAVDLRREATRKQLSQKRRRPVDKCADYLDKYGPMLEYGSYLADGLHIASGVIEGACRHLIKDRLDRTGARWRIKSAEAIIRICAVLAEKTLDREFSEIDRKILHGDDIAYTYNSIEMLVREILSSLASHTPKPPR